MRALFQLTRITFTSVHILGKSTVEYYGDYINIWRLPGGSGLSNSVTHVIFDGITYPTNGIIIAFYILFIFFLNILATTALSTQSGAPLV